MPDLVERKQVSYDRGHHGQAPAEDHPRCFNLAAAERQFCVAALVHAGNIVGAAQLLGITRHALKRRMIKLRIDPAVAAATRIA